MRANESRKEKKMRGEVLVIGSSIWVNEDDIKRGKGHDKRWTMIEEAKEHRKRRWRVAV